MVFVYLYLQVYLCTFYHFNKTTLLCSLWHNFDIYKPMCVAKQVWVLMRYNSDQTPSVQITIRHLTFLRTTCAPKYMCLHSSLWTWFWGLAPHVWSNKSFIPDVMSTRDGLYEARAQTPALAHSRSRALKLYTEFSNFNLAHASTPASPRRTKAALTPVSPVFRLVLWDFLLHNLFSCKLCLSPSAILWRIDDSAQRRTTF